MNLNSKDTIINDLNLSHNLAARPRAGWFLGLLLLAGLLAANAQPGVIVTNLHSFSAATNAENPQSSLAQGSDGNFHGTTYLGGTRHHFVFRTPQLLGCGADEPSPDLLAKAGNPQWLRARPDDGATNFIQLGSRVVLRLKNPADLPALIAGADLQLSRTVTPDTFILQAPNAWLAAQQAHLLAALPEVLASYPVMRRHAGLHGAYAPLPSDTLFDQQWYLENRNPDGSSVGPDLNVRAAWPWTLGQGVTVALGDTGIEMAHQELSNNVNGPNTNFFLQNSNALPVARDATAAHGTEVAGLVAAAIDNFRMTGVAPGAQLASWVIFDDSGNLAADEQLLDMYQYESNNVAVQNHSWGLEDTAVTQGGPSLLEQIGISNALTFGRNGLGVIMVRSAANGRLLGDNAVDSAYASDPRVIAVAADYDLAVLYLEAGTTWQFPVELAFRLFNENLLVFDLHFHLGRNGDRLLSNS